MENKSLFRDSYETFGSNSQQNVTNKKRSIEEDIYLLNSFKRLKLEDSKEDLRVLETPWNLQFHKEDYSFSNSKKEFCKIMKLDMNINPQYFHNLNPFDKYNSFTEKLLFKEQNDLPDYFNFLAKELNSFNLQNNILEEDLLSNNKKIIKEFLNNIDFIKWIEIVNVFILKLTLSKSNMSNVLEDFIYFIRILTLDFCFRNFIYSKIYKRL